MKRFLKTLAVFALVFTMLLGSTQPILAVTTEELNNKSDESVSVKLVNAENSTGSFTVNCAGTEDEIKVYQVATMEWNTDSFDDPQWVNAVSTWLTGNGSSYATFTTPVLLAAQSESVQGDFFKALIHEENGIINADGLQKWSSDAADTEKGYITDSGIVVEKDDNGDFKTDAYSIVNVPLGIYVIVGSSGAKTYAPAVVNLIPDRDPTGKWYVDNNIEATMKAADAYMHKFINGGKTDIVTIGEEVDFTIEFPLPEYIDRGNQAIYTLTFDDVLSDAFTLDTDSVVIKYRTDASTSWEDAQELSKDNYTALIAAPAPASDPNGYGITVWGCGYHHLKYKDTNTGKVIEYVIYRNKYKDKTTGQDKYAYYYYKEGAYHVIYDSTIQYDKDNLSALQAEYKRLTGDGTGHSFVQFNADGTVNGSGGSTSPTEVQEYFEGKNGYEYVASLFHNIFNITFNYNKLIENNLHNQNVDIQITYKAQVNKNIEVNSENNTNTATMKYEINAAGDKFATISDTVKAYTYGLNLVKMDGDTYQTTQATDAQGALRFEADGSTPIYEDPTYLEGAKFHVFKETDTFIGEEYKGSMPGSPDAESLKTDPVSLTEYKATHTGEGKYYYYTYVANADTTLDNEVAVTSGNTVTRVFQLVELADKTYGTYFDGTLTSEAKAEGVVLKGLDEGNYIVSEYLAPTGYNLLAEDMMFSIYKISDNKAEENGGSYKLFAGNKAEEGVEQNVDDDGLYAMNVLNYAGLTLPSTGGVGTMLFTMIGILLMVAAIVVIMMKNKKNMKYAAEFMAILLVVGMLFQLTPQNVYAVTEVKLNNEYGSSVTGDNKVSFTVNIKNPGDSLEVYKIAEMKWDGSTYNGPSWVLGVQQALAGSSYVSYTTPALLGAATVDDQVAFFEWLYTNKDSNNLEQNQKVPAANIVESVSGEQITVSNVDYGIYLIKAVNTNSGKNYQLLTVDAIPTQEGPLGAWYIKDNISATLKFADIKVEKKINSEDGITVSMGDEVEFQITGEVPDYPGVDTGAVDSEGNPVKDFSSYFFTMNDTMSGSFEFDREKDIVIEYSVDNSTWNPLSTEAYESLFVSAANDLNTVGVRRYKDNLTNNDIYCIVSGPDASNGNKYTFDFYVYSEEDGTYTKFYTYNNTTSISYYGQSITASAVLTPYKNTTGRTTATTLTLNTAEWTDINNIVFDYEKLHELGAKYVRVTYNAVVTPEVVVGTDDNTNTVTFHYQKDLSGAGGSSSDTAYAWTYGLNIVKKDGDETSTYLANAKFKLYKEAYIYVPSIAGADKTEATYANYAFLKNIDETTDVPTGIISAEEGATAENLDTLEKLNSVINGDYYYRYVAYKADECGVDTCVMKSAEHSHVHAYKFIGVNGDGTSEIISVSTPDGVTVKGLAPASYVLIETEAPTGYNKLQEALRFEIQELTDEQASALGLRTADGKVSLKGFASDETYEKTQIDGDSTLKYAQVGEGEDAVYYKVYEDGIYPIEVENFKGLTLPSTGGMGTLFFTLIGLFVMIAALVVIIAKRNGQKYIEY